MWCLRSRKYTFLAREFSGLSFFFSWFPLRSITDNERWLSIDRTRASRKRDAQASSAVGLLRRHLIPYSRRGVRHTACTDTHARTIARTRVYTMWGTTNTHARASIPPFHSSASRLNSHRRSDLSPPHANAALVSYLLSCAMRVHACSCTRVCRQPANVLQSIGTDCQHLRAAWNAFSFRKPPKIADRLWPRYRTRTTKNYWVLSKIDTRDTARDPEKTWEGHRKCG